MDLWIVFVLSQLRLCLNLSYEMVHNLANNHHALRYLMGVERDFGYDRVEFEYQNIYDNVSMLSNESDSFVVESNVHFPTDYNLLWDCARKCLDVVSTFIGKYENIENWRKIANWDYGLKGLMRKLGKASASVGKNKQDRMIFVAKKYLTKAKALVFKLSRELPCFPQNNISDISLIIALEHFIVLLNKHIDLVERRILKGGAIKCR